MNFHSLNGVDEPHFVHTTIYPTNIQKLSKYYTKKSIYFNLFCALIDNINNNYYIKFAIYIFYIIFAFVEKRVVDRGEMEYKSISQALDVVDKEEGMVSGYLSAFGNIDSDGDMIMPGAFKRTIEDWGPNGRRRIKHFLDHDNTKSVGVFTVLKEDDYGLYYESKAGDWSAGVDFWKMVKAGAITEHSIGFKTLKKEKAEGFTKLTEIKLYEGSSLQGHGANEFTPIMGFKSLDDMEAYFDRIDYALKHGKCTDDEITRIEQYVKSLDTYFKTRQPDAESGKTIVPDEVKDEGDRKLLLQTFKEALGTWQVKQNC